MLNWLPKLAKRVPGAMSGVDGAHFPNYDGVASREDIFRCFRLLLGRNPNAEEWPGHAGLAGRPLAEVVAAYLNSRECGRRGLLDHAPSNVERVESTDYCIYVATDDNAVGRHVRAGLYEANVTAVFHRELRPGMGVLDIGANIGHFTMLSAAKVGPGGWVGAVEPNPANARLLEISRKANGFDHVTVMQVAAGRAVGLLALHTSHSNGTTSALPDDLDAALAAKTIPCVPLDSLVPDGRRIDLVKVDVEGAEYNALFGCQQLIARWRPSIISEFAPGMIRDISGVSGADYLDWLAGEHYALHVIEADGSLSGTMDTAGVIAAHAATGLDHVDIFGRPLPG